MPPTKPPTVTIEVDSKAFQNPFGAIKTYKLRVLEDGVPTGDWHTTNLTGEHERFYMHENATTPRPEGITDAEYERLRIRRQQLFATYYERKALRDA